MTCSPRSRRARATIACGLIAAAIVAPQVSGRGDAATTQQRLDQVRAEYRQLQDDADELAARIAEADTETDRLVDAVAVNRRRVRTTDSQVRAARVELQQLAASMYVQSAATSPMPTVSSGSVLDDARAAVYGASIAQRNRSMIDKYRGLQDRLDQQRSELRRDQRRQETVARELRAASDRINAKLTKLAALRRELGTQVIAEEAARRRQAEEARRRASTPRGSTRGGPSRPVRNGGGSTGGSGGSYGVALCPIQGPLSFTDTWLAPRSGGRRHQGVDLISPTGTANVAVVSGTLQYRQGNIMGNGIFLYGDNGNTYYYFHLSRYAGPARHVERGEVIGYTGSTGTGTPHTHFEIHPGGGSAVNPYPAVRAVC